MARDEARDFHAHDLRPVGHGECKRWLQQLTSEWPAACRDYQVHGSVGFADPTMGTRLTGARFLAGEMDFKNYLANEPRLIGGKAAPSRIASTRHSILFSATCFYRS